MRATQPVAGAAGRRPGRQTDARSSSCHSGQAQAATTRSSLWKRMVRVFVNSPITLARAGALERDRVAHEVCGNADDQRLPGQRTNSFAETTGLGRINNKNQQEESVTGIGKKNQ